jgi:hypothetical protein
MIVDKYLTVKHKILLQYTQLQARNNSLQRNFRFTTKYKSNIETNGIFVLNVQEKRGSS